MPKVVLFIAMSLDGYIASQDGTVDWLFHDADYEYTESTPNSWLPLMPS